MRCQNHTTVGSYLPWKEQYRVGISTQQDQRKMARSLRLSAASGQGSRASAASGQGVAEEGMEASGQVSAEESSEASGQGLAYFGCKSWSE